MKPSHIIFLFLAALTWLCPKLNASDRSDNSTQYVGQTLLDAFEESLRYDLLYPYYPTAVDAQGGFVEDRGGSWELQQGSDKWVVPQARYVWMGAKASQFYAHDPEQAAIYLSGAAHGFEFLQRMWGYDYGSGRIGMALVVNNDGSNGRIGNKEMYLTYGHGHALYGVAAYYDASGETAALDLAIQIYNFIDDNLYDPTYGGYYISLSDQGKDTNVNLHVLEALIEFYHALPSGHSLRVELESRMNDLLAIFHDTAIQCQTSTDCFAHPLMNRDWSPANSNVSFGHDAELTFLMVEAMMAMGEDPMSSPYLEKIKKVVDFTFSHEGYRNDGAVYYTGRYNSGTITIIDSQLQWWPQGEGISAVAMMMMLYPDEQFYTDVMNLSWSYIESDVIDHTNHGWVRLAGQMSIGKASEWHANYHCGRAMINCLTWLADKLIVAAEPTDGGTASPDIGAHWIVKDDVVAITAVPNIGYAFDHWSGDVADPNAASTMITMSGDEIVTAHFVAGATYDLTLTVDPAGAGTTAPEAGVHAYPEGVEVTLKANPNTGFRFDHWTGNVDDPNSATTTITMEDNQTVTAHFVAVPTYNLTISVDPAGAGTTEPSIGIHTYEENSEITISAMSAAGYIFDYWSGDVDDPYSPTTTITMDDNKNIAAYFVEPLPGNITYMGDIGSANGESASDELIINTTLSVTEGDAIIIAFTTYGDPDYTVSITDDAGNVYEEAAQSICYSHGRTYIFAAYDVNSLVAGSDITITHTNVSGGTAAVGSVFRGLQTVDPLDQALGNPAVGTQESFSGTTPTVGPTGMTAIPDELLIGAIGTEGPVGDNPGTWDYAFMAGPRAGTTNATQSRNWTVSMGYRIVSSVGEYTAQKTGITDQYWAAAIATFRAEPAPALGILGDGSGDEVVNSTDALIILSCDAGINVSAFCPMNCGDVNNDAMVNSTDALIILSYDVGMSVPFAVGEPGCPNDVTQCPGCLQ